MLPASERHSGMKYLLRIKPEQPSLEIILMLSKYMSSVRDKQLWYICIAVSASQE